MNLLILPFDHRSSFERDLGLKDKKKISLAKYLIFSGFVLAQSKYKSLETDGGILVDDCYGKEILLKSKKKKIITMMPVEKSGQTVLKWDHGSDFGKYIKEIKPDYVKVLLRYNPANKSDNVKQLYRLQELNAWCKKNKYKSLVELLPEGRGKEAELLSKSIKEIQTAIKPNVWKIPGLNTGREWRLVLSQILSVDKKAKVIVLGRAQSDKVLKQWLKAGKNAWPNKKDNPVIGFAIGRSIFMPALQLWVKNKIDDKKAIEMIAEKYLYFVKYWRGIK